MEIVKTYGQTIEKLSEKNPDRAQKLLKLGWQAQNLKFRFFPNKQLLPADRYLAELMMDTMIAPLKDPEHSAIVSIFTPCELLQEVGLHPYNVEGFSCYLTASAAERVCLQQAENQGISETLCSYHKAFLGAAQKGILPKPKCIVYTNLTCDANQLTFRTLADLYQVPAFAIDVPMEPTEENIKYVADQLRELCVFLEQHTGKRIEEAALKKRTERSKETLEKYRKFQEERAGKYVPADLVTPLYAGMTNNLLLGTPEEARYVDRLLKDIKQAKPKKGTRIYWMHTIPFWSESVKNALLLKEEAQIVGCELAEVCEPDFDPSYPYEAMAALFEESKMASAMPEEQEPMVWSGSDTGGASILWERLSWQRRSLKKQASHC